MRNIIYLHLSQTARNKNQGILNSSLGLANFLFSVFFLSCKRFLIKELLRIYGAYSGFGRKALRIGLNI